MNDEIGSHWMDFLHCETRYGVHGVVLLREDSSCLQLTILDHHFFRPHPAVRDLGQGESPSSLPVVPYHIRDTQSKKQPLGLLMTPND